MNSWRPILESVLWASAAGVVYAYAGYPILIWACARLFGRRRSWSDAAPLAELPRVSLLIAAHNEEAVIGDRLRNALLLDYPQDKLEIVVTSDGSVDETASTVRRFEPRGVRLIDNPVRRGKAASLNAAVPELSGEIVILSDANTHMDPRAVRSLVRWFADPRVGVVCGRLVLNDPISGENVDGMYWRYETFLKRHEGRLGALLGSNGAIYAIRKGLYHPIPDQTIVDDFVIPLLSKLRTGCQIVYDPDAIAEEDSAPDMATEFRRRTRIGAGGWQAIGILRGMLNPARGWVAFTFFSHKVLRWLCPFFLLLMLGANALLWGTRMYDLILSVQLVAYALAWAGGRVSRGVPLARLLRLAYMFMTMNAALFVGFFKWISGTQRGTWTRTRRAGEAPSRPVAELRV